jgi:hypothetical protein
MPHRAQDLSGLSPSLSTLLPRALKTLSAVYRPFYPSLILGDFANVKAVALQRRVAALGVAVLGAAVA